MICARIEKIDLNLECKETEGGKRSEGKTVCQENLREMQDHQAQGPCHGHLREPKA